MATLTSQQLAGLDIASQRLQKYGTNYAGYATDLKNVNYAKKTYGYTYTPKTVAPTQTVAPQAPAPAPTYDVIQDPQYQEQVALWGQQQANDIAGLQGQITSTEQSYESQKQQVIRSYQDAIDSINQSLRQTGIGIQGSYAGRNLYDASGQVSGIGQGYAANILSPIYQNLTKTSTRQAEDLASLEQRKTTDISGLKQKISSVPLSYEQQKLDLKNKILSAVAEAKAKEEEARAKAEENSPRALQLKERRDQESKGREYLSTPAAVTAAKKAGRTVIKVGNDMFALGPMEQLDYNQKLKNYNKVSGGGGGGDTITKDEKAFYDDIEQAQKDLRSGYSWGSVWNRMKSKYGTPSDILDDLLEKDTWSKAGAYESYKKKTKSTQSQKTITLNDGTVISL